MRISEEGIELIKRFESFRGRPYICPAGKWTIGYGSTFYPDGTSVTPLDKEITEQEAEGILLVNLEDYERYVNRVVDVEVTQSEFDALTSFCYNVGSGNFGTSTLLRMLNEGYAKAFVADQFDRWVHGGNPKRVLNGLVRRRAAEKALFLK